MKSYHLVLGVLLTASVAAFGAPEEKRDETLPPLMVKAPPRTIDDILKIVDHYKQDSREAEQARVLAAAPPPATEDRQALFKFYVDRAINADKIGRSRQGIEDMRKALEFGERGREETIRAMQLLASFETTTGNLLEGIKVAEENRAQIPRNLLGLALGAEQLLVLQYALAGDFESARKHVREAEGSITLLRRSPRWGDLGLNWTALYERARGEMFAAEGNLVAAEQSFRRALKSQEEYLAKVTAEGKLTSLQLDGPRRFIEILQRMLGNVLLRRGQIVEAEVLVRKSLQSALTRVGRASTDSGQCLVVLSRIIGEQGRYAEAYKLAATALQAFQASGAGPESISVIATHKQIGSILASQGRYTEAIAAFKRVREAGQVSPEVLRRVGAGDLDWVLAMLRTGDQKGAEEMAMRMFEFSRSRFGDQDLRTHATRAFHGMTLAARGDLAGARTAFETSAPPLIAQAMEDGGAEGGALKRQQRLTLILESYLRVLSELGSSPEHAATAFRLADIARSSGVQRALNASAARASIRDPRLAELARREQDAHGRIGSLSELLTQLLSTPPEQQLPKIQARITADIESLKAERSQLKKEIAQAFPDYAELVDPKPVTAAAAQKILKPGEVLLSYYFGEDKGYVWALRSGGEIGFAPILLDRAAMAQQVGRLRAALDPQVATIAELPAFDAAAAHDLYTKLVGPVAGSLNDASLLLVVPHGELGQLPLAVLPTELPPAADKSAVPFDTYRKLPWLIRKVAIEQLPSVTALASLRRLPPASASRQSFVGFGDPLFSKDQVKSAALAPASSAMATRGVPLRLRNVPKTSGVSSAELALLPRLPDTGQEIAEIAAVFKAAPGDIFLQARATEKAVLDADLSNRRVVMFATHGLVPGELNGLTQPALALTTPDLADGNGDGLLAMDEILSLKLNADWVVLSACNTAAGNGAGSEAVSGLGRAFFYAGARALLVSNWPVETVSARLLMTDLFRRQVANPSLGKAEALRQAMLALADGPGSLDPKTGKPLYSHAHPLFWAPFVVVGD